MTRYIPARERIIHLNKRRGHALFEFVRKLADKGNPDARAFEGVNEVYRWFARTQTSEPATP